MQSEVAYTIRPDIILVHSANIAVLEQKSFLSQERTLCIICTGGTGFAAVGVKAPKAGYLTLDRWAIKYPGAVSFCVPNDKILSIQMTSTALLEKRYHSEEEAWQTICNATRYCVLPVVTRDNAST